MNTAMNELGKFELLLRRMLAGKEYRADIKELLLDMVDALAATSSEPTEEIVPTGSYFKPTLIGSQE